jgi:hypothetical protein
MGALQQAGAYAGVHAHRKADDVLGQVVAVGNLLGLPWGVSPLAGSWGGVYGGLILMFGVDAAEQVSK